MADMRVQRRKWRLWKLAEDGRTMVPPPIEVMAESEWTARWLASQLSELPISRLSQPVLITDEQPH